MRVHRLLRWSSLSLALALGVGCNNTGISGGDNPDGGAVVDMRIPLNPDAFWAADPPARSCVVDGGTPVLPGGTPECPDDKNREGCPCPAAGMTASCWPGLRANRGLGVCKDGVTTCQRIGEVYLGWGPCQGYTLPTPGATTGKAACECFSAGRWQVDNLLPCILNGADGTPGGGGAVSTIIVNGQAQCPPLPIMQPATAWSTDRVTADCGGHFQLCYSIKAGDVANPQAGDCEIVKVCTEADYTTGATKDFPSLPSWISTSAAAKTCTLKFDQTGGYGEMSVVGTSITCDGVGPKVFNRVKYCPRKCLAVPPPNVPECMNCGQGGSGTF